LEVQGRVCNSIKPLSRFGYEPNVNTATQTSMDARAAAKADL
jgi:hypothetical protein